MNLFRISLAVALSVSIANPVWAQEKPVANANSTKLTLAQYLREVRENNPEAIALTQNVEGLKRRIDEAELELTPYAFANYLQLEDEKPTAAPVFQGTENKATTWALGIGKKTSFGLTGEVYVESNDIDIVGADPNLLTTPSYNEARGVIELRQALWKNGFGAMTRNLVIAGQETAKADLLEETYKLQQLLVNAESVYWQLASLNEVIKLQDQSVSRAKRMSDLMQRRYGQKLVDDVDYLQTQSALQSRELEWQNLVDEREGLYRSFNTYRGLAENAVPQELDLLPTQEWLARQKINPAKSRRADFEARKSRAKSERAKAKAGSSSVNPELDLIGSYASNGRDERFSDSFDQIGENDRPTWTVGVQLKVPLDFGLMNDVKSGYKNQIKAGDEKLNQAEFQERRAFEDAFNRRNEAQVRYERMVELEKIQSRMVERERLRLNNGRTTTFQMIDFEQNLAGTQIQRVRAQRELIETHNQLKLFQESL